MDPFMDAVKRMWVLERHVKGALGIRQVMDVLERNYGRWERIQKLREESLTAGQDYLKSGRNVLYSAAGVEKMAGLIRLSASSQAEGGYEEEDLQDGANVAAAQALAPSQELMEQVLEVLPKKRVRVVKVFATNPQYLHAMTVDGKEGLLTVRVRDSRHFLPGMEMDVLKSVGGVWDYVGHLPRSRGRW